jgi:hypothetical protein
MAWSPRNLLPVWTTCVLADSLAERSLLLVRGQVRLGTDVARDAAEGRRSVSYASELAAEQVKNRTALRQLIRLPTHLSTTLLRHGALHDAIEETHRPRDLTGQDSGCLTLGEEDGEADKSSQRSTQGKQRRSAHKFSDRPQL